MAEKYFIECQCGKRISVELFEAGTTKTCNACNSSVDVPNTSILKERSGDKYPLLRPIEKIRRTLENAEPPFDGFCHVCGDIDAEFQVPIAFDALIERIVRGNGGIRPTLTGDIKLVAGAAEEYWQTTTIPLLLCPQCYSKFQTENSRANTIRNALMVVVLGLFAGFLYFAYFNAEVVAAAAGLLSLIGGIAWVAKFRQTKKTDPFVNRWLSNIRWVPEAIAAVDEYKLIVGTTQPYERRREPNGHDRLAASM
ncbi:MAG: hypothetical protein WCJ09_00540 [Planctomycetota bacterium]